MKPLIVSPSMGLDRLIHMISHAVDLVGVDDYYHSRRVGLIAVQLAKAMGYRGETLQFINHAGLLHDCGVSSTRVHRQLVNAIDWDGAWQHCQIGYDLLKDYPPLACFAPLVLYHHSHWSDLIARDLPRETAILANLIFLADRIDVLSAPFYDDTHLLSQTDSIRIILQHYRGDVFAPELMDAFLDESRADAFWIPLMTTEMVQSCQRELSDRYVSPMVEWSLLRGAADILAKVVDAKSPFTHQHSLGVAKLSHFLASEMGMTQLRCEMIEFAGLLHDIGKLCVDDAILEAPRELSELEMSKMRMHSYMTHNILRGIGELDEVAAWAAQHHERLDGTGYPFHIKEHEISLESRIISVADVYQALAQNRPYRGSRPQTHIFSIMDRMVMCGQLDGDIVNTAKAHSREIDRAAMVQ